MRTPEEQADRDMSEANLSREVDRLRKKHRWLGHNTTNNHVARAAIKGDKGFPDWLLARPPRLLLIELKREGMAADPLQVIWADQLLTAREHGLAIEYYVLRPSDLRSGLIEDILR